MLKPLGIIASLLVAPGAFAAEVTFSDLVKTPEGGKALTALMSHQHLPNWIKTGGVESPAQTVTVKGNDYQVYTICKPHNCGNQQFAVLYSAKLKQMSGLYLQANEKLHRETLQWLNVSDELSIDGKTILYAATTGSLSNHPKAFNYGE
ncbi:C-lysozyme inhibitor [Rosenbergiella sp. S61]|uniref:C-lysozyme inhibitor n=1 Tax=Rosenbergiella gaditana TaxID=2726987 RepID=A0ABS5SVL4_9GAMM|nr:Ivy family c-type lysozyme inhibitor [Rosenbergiella gaditana]MBT0724147.1 C-lysozyme inhibitor [Rosenbergiella gaditana]